MFISKALLRYHARTLVQSPSTGIFLGFGWMLAILLTLSYGDFLAANNAGLEQLFAYIPWVLCLLIPALTMNVAEENARGITERLNTLPFAASERLASRFLVHWLLIGLWLVGFWPMVATVAYLGNPDYGPIVSGFLGTWFFAAPLLAASLFVTRFATGSVTGYLVSLGACLVLTVTGMPQTIGWLAGAVPSFMATPLIIGLQKLAPLSALSQYVAGLAPLGGTLLLIGFTAVFLLITLPRSKRHLIALGIAILFIATPLISPLTRIGIDFTSANLHTLSPASKNILHNLKEPITLTLYQSLNNPDIPPAVLQNAEALRQLLITLRHENPSKIQLAAINTDASPAHALQAMRSGLEEQVLPSGTGFFSGLAAQTGSHLSLIRALNPARQPFLEFDVMSLINENLRTHKPTISMLSPLNTENPTAIPRWLGEIGTAYNLHPLLLAAAEIPSDTDLLLILGNPTIPAQTVAALSTFIESGGKVLWLADPMWRSIPADQVTTEGALTIADVIARYGIHVHPESVVADLSLATPVAQEDTGYTTYPFWLSMTAANLNPSFPFSTFVDSLLFAEPGAITTENLQSGLTFTPILTTSANAQLMPRETFNVTPAELLASQLSGPKAKRTLAALVTGNFGPQATAPGTLMVFNDADWLGNIFALRALETSGPGSPVEMVPVNSNLIFFFNALQYALGETELVELRGKATTKRTLTRVENLLAELSRGTTQLEQSLAAQLYDISQRLEALQAANPGEEQLSTAQSAEVESFKQQEFQVRQQLRELRSATRHQLQGLKTAILLLNLLVMPVLLAIAILCYRRRQAKAA